MLKARIRNRLTGTIGCSTRCSTSTKATRSSTPPTRPAMHPRVRPAGAVGAVRLDPVGDRHEERGQAEAEGEVAGDVDLRPASLPELDQRLVAPDGPEDADRHAHPEHRAPVPLGEQATDDQAEERPRDRGDLVDAQRHPSLVGGEGVGEDRRGVGEQHRTTDTLADAHHDQPHRAGPAGEGVHREQHGEDGEHEEAEVVHLDAAVHVAEAPQRHHQDGGDDEEAHDDPEQVADVARLERVEVDAPEDGRQRDDHDRGVDRGHQHAERGVGQGHPAVVRVVPVEAR